MKRLVFAFCGAAALGLAAMASGANATPLKPVNPVGGTVSNITEEVRWRRVCRPVWRGPVQVMNCRNVWVGPPRGYNNYGYGPGPRPGPRYGWGPGPGYGYGNGYGRGYY